MKKPCSFCEGGALHSEILPHYDQLWGDETYRFENVPALVCNVCGEIYFEANVDQAMDKALAAAQASKPERYARVPLLDLHPSL